MTVKELIRQLQNFDGDLDIEVSAEYNLVHDLSGDTVDSVEYKHGVCVLYCDEKRLIDDG